MVIIVIYLLMAKKSLYLKPKKQSVVGKLSLGNISADFNQADKKPTGLYEYIYMILVLIIMLFPMIKHTIFMLI